MPKPSNLHWSQAESRWQVRGRDGHTKAYIGEGGIGGNTVTAGTLVDTQGLDVGDGTTTTFIKKYTGTLAGGSIGTGAIKGFTVTGSHACTRGDLVFANLKTDVTAGHVGIAGAMVPSNNRVDVWMQNSKPDSAGSIPATGVDVFIIRSA